MFPSDIAKALTEKFVIRVAADEVGVATLAGQFISHLERQGVSVVPTVTANRLPVEVEAMLSGIHFVQDPAGHPPAAVQAEFPSASLSKEKKGGEKKGNSNNAVPGFEDFINQLGGGASEPDDSEES